MTTLPSSSSKVKPVFYLNDIVVPSARNVDFNSQYNFKVITLFYSFRVGRAFGATEMFNYENRQMAHTSDFKVFTSINHVHFAHSWVDKKWFPLGKRRLYVKGTTDSCEERI
jgi:hypothetical protein